MFRSCPNEKVVSSYFLLAVLNSKVFWTWAKHRMPTLGSGWYSYRVSILRQFPIPTPPHSHDNPVFDEVANLAAKLLDKKLSVTDRTNILSSADNKVCELYGIS